MGIKNLNRFLRENCTKKSINNMHLNQLKNKTIVIDTSIYLYKFHSDNALMENMYLFISILKSYQICPIFIFDGKPPPEKRDLLIQRRLEKKEAESKYKSLQTEFTNNNTITDEEQKEILIELENLKRQFIRIRDEDIRKVKDLMDAYGVIYYDAPSEADQLCAYFVKSGRAWACISDDMDMFLYGCPYVIRHLSLMKHSAVLYDTKSILTELDMSEMNFIEIMVLSGTDYNIHSTASLAETIKWFYEYNKYCKHSTKNNTRIFGFYVWLVKNTKYISDYGALLKTYQMFQNIELEIFDTKYKYDLIERPIDIPRIQQIMVNEGFVFT